MKTYGKWKDLNITCVHCGSKILCRPIYKEGVYIKGFEPMEFKGCACAEPYYKGGMYNKWRST